ncbi:MAG: hypothetical protein PHT07_24360 [Paludibacter sp.]|nr:hypothetical protein [Paludibacter sp.]
MHVSEILANHLAVANGDIQDICSICGRKTNFGHDKKKSVSANFNDYQHFKYDTDCICEFCYACLSSNTFNEKTLRNYSIIANEKQIIVPDRPAIIVNINYPPDPPFVFMVSFSKKKHIFLHAKINTSEIINIATDKYDLSFTKEQFNNVLLPCSKLYEAGFSKTEIERGEYRKWKVIDETPEFFRLNNEIQKHRGTHLLNFVLYTLSKETEDDKD